jgi:divalent metal cation (Fe/Co/Zn/Cd) transporter
MDASDPRLLADICQVLETHRPAEWIDIHQLRAWRSGNFVHIDLHLVLPRHYTLEAAHRQAKAVERLLIDHFAGRAGVLVHMDPCGDALSGGKSIPCWQDCTAKTDRRGKDGQYRFIRLGTNR